jgi:hypothetical protein
MCSILCGAPPPTLSNGSWPILFYSFLLLLQNIQESQACSQLILVPKFQLAAAYQFVEPQAYSQLILVPKLQLADAYQF